MLSVASRRFLQTSTLRMSAHSIYQFTVKDADGKDVSLEKYKGKVVVVVNVASQCGLTNSNYTQLKELLDKYKPQGLEVAAFPCNQFGGQEPACELDIKNFVQDKFKFEPDLYAKVDVNGDKADPLFKFLKKEKGGTLIDAIKWNFTKFLVDKEGNVVKRYGPTTEPKEMVKEIEHLLASNPKI
ncbi:putative phospholipid hydroperoxide glutathione peroxidase [Ancylostoma caninum]|uniref:Glutathione peroxidase n=1 Tax=Ancylostoma caninum TaxID=29170 RepID=A0A368FSR8_ANCCA|nr:putative phospholipid hydroperoxide glutathione peroxidase [Ancylostoma caninum]